MIKPYLGKKFWHFSKIEKIIIGITLTAILLVSIFGLFMDANQSQPIIVDPQDYSPTATPTSEPTTNINPTATQKPQAISNPTAAPWVPVITGPQTDSVTPGVIESNPSMDNSTWRAIAQNAWYFFQPGQGIDSTTGLPASSLGWNYFTDWDLAVYIQAVIDAQKIGLIGQDGEWGSHARLEKVVRFLETRELNSTTHVPYWFYCSDGNGYLPQSNVDIVDTGTLLVALSNLKQFDSSFASRIDNFVYNRASGSMHNNSGNRTDYESVVPNVLSDSLSSNSIYTYYMSSGFASFFPQQLQNAPSAVLETIRNSGIVTTYNVSLPKAGILCEPLLYSVFNLRNNSYFDTYLFTLMNQTYSAHEAAYNSTSKYLAYSEGIGPTGFIWEWVVTPYGETWKIVNSTGSNCNINPVIYTKVSLSFLALYNTPFAHGMSVYLEKLWSDPSNGYCAGADYNTNLGLANVYASVDSNTNGLILSAARYALKT
jgi:hypothetical protein